MVKKPFKGNYLTFEVRVSYDENTDTVHLTSKDKELLAESGFHLALNSGRDAEETLRTLLERKGMMPEFRYQNVPTRISYEDSPSKDVWDKFPLGMHSNGKEAIWDSSTYPHILMVGEVGSGKSTIHRNLISHCVQNSDIWNVLIIDPSRVELSPYKKRHPDMIEVVSSVADSVAALRTAQSKMMNRFEQMEQAGTNNFRDLPEPPKALMIMIDEANYFLTPSQSRGQESLDENELRAEARDIITKILSLGRAAGIQMVISSQHLDADVITGDIVRNCSTRIASGPLNYSQSKVLLGNNQATRLNRQIRGRGYMQQHGKGSDFQGYYSEPEFLDIDRKPDTEF